MSKNALLMILVFAGGAAVSVVRLRTALSQNQALIQENQQQAEQIKNLKATLLKEHLKEQTEYLAEKTTVEGLQQQLKQAQDSLALAEARMNKAHNFGAGGEEIGSLQDKLNQQKSLVADLESSLKGVRERLHQVGQQDSQSQKDYGINQKQSDLDAKAQIQVQRDTLKQMIAQENQLKKQRYDFDAQQKLKDLDYQISQQKNLIAQMNDQRSATAQQYGSEKNQNHFISETQKQELVRSEQDIQAQVNNEKGNLVKMQKDVQTGVSGKKAREDEIRSAEADYRTQKAKVQEIQASLQVEQQKLQSLATPATQSPSAAASSISPTPGSDASGTPSAQ
jgi:DNA repair exonuclease SbcCD ATPase subunit